MCHKSVRLQQLVASMQEEAFLKRYLEYCRSRSAPVLSETAGRVLANEYVELREEVQRYPGWDTPNQPLPSPADTGTCCCT